MLGENATILKEALQNNLSKASGLVIDLRGRGGKVFVINIVAKLLKDQNQPFSLLTENQEVLKKCSLTGSKDYHTSPWLVKPQPEQFFQLPLRI